MIGCIKITYLGTSWKYAIKLNPFHYSAIRFKSFHCFLYFLQRAGHEHIKTKIL